MTERIRSAEFHAPRHAVDADEAKRNDAIRRLAEQLPAQWSRGSVLLEEIGLTNGSAKAVGHKLGRRHKGYFLVRSRGQAVSVVTELATSHADYNALLEDSHVQLVSSADVTISMVVF